MLFLKDSSKNEAKEREPILFKFILAYRCIEVVQKFDDESIIKYTHRKRGSRESIWNSLYNRNPSLFTKHSQSRRNKKGYTLVSANAIQQKIASQCQFSELSLYCSGYQTGG